MFKFIIICIDIRQSDMDVANNYEYVGVFPVSIPNGIWVVMSLLLFTMYVSTYHIQSTNIFGNILQYVLEYGKYKSFHAATDLPKR